MVTSALPFQASLPPSLPLCRRVCVSLSPSCLVWSGQRLDWSWSAGWPNLISCLLHTHTHTHTHTKTHTHTHTHTHRHPFVSRDRLIGLRPRGAWGQERRRVKRWGGRRGCHYEHYRTTEIKVRAIESPAPHYISNLPDERDGDGADRGIRGGGRRDWWEERRKGAREGSDNMCEIYLCVCKRVPRVNCVCVGVS